MLNKSGNEKKGRLRSRMINAGGWVALAFICGQVLRFGSNLILTRLLVPEMFGVMAIVTVIQIGLVMFSDVGLLQNIVQSRRGEDRLFLNTAWVVQVVRGCLIYLIMLIFAWLLSMVGDFGWLPQGSAYDEPILPTVLAVMATTALFDGFSSTKRHAAIRNMMLARVSLLDFVCQFVSVVIVLTLAWLEPSIWAIVIGSLVASAGVSILSHFVLLGDVNKFEWDASAFYEIFHFGKWLFLSSIVSFFVNQGDRLLLGGLISATMLGIYSIAFFLANALKLLLSKVNSLVFFPALSEVVRDRPEDLSNAYYKIRRWIDGVSFFVAGLLFSSGGQVVSVLYDDRYLEAGWMLQVLSLSIASIGFSAAGQCFLALGKSKLNLAIGLVQLIILFGGVIPAFSLYGLVGAVYVIALAPVFSGFFAWYPMYRLGLLRIFKECVMLPCLLVGYVFGKALMSFLM